MADFTFTDPVSVDVFLDERERLSNAILNRAKIDPAIRIDAEYSAEFSAAESHLKALLAAEHDRTERLIAEVSGRAAIDVREIRRLKHDHLARTSLLIDALVKLYSLSLSRHIMIAQ